MFMSLKVFTDNISNDPEIIDLVMDLERFISSLISTYLPIYTLKGTKFSLKN